MHNLIRAATWICLLCTVNLSAGTTTSRQRAWDLYRNALARSCPDKHLEMLAPGELIDTVDEFTKSLPSNKKIVVKASIKRTCSGVEMGASCDNTGFLQAAVRLGELDHFVARMCTLRERCTDYSKCTEIK